MKQEKDLTQKKSEKEKKAKMQTNKYILHMIYLFVLLFVGLIAYLCYFTWKEAPDLVNSPYNGRLNKLNETCVRGDLVSSDGEVLATTKQDENGEDVRTYPYHSVFSHVVGYTSVGEAGLESSASYYLLNSHESSWNKL